MNGPPRFLVSQPSATSCLPAGASSAHSIPLRLNHSDLVKFSSHDAEYDRVAYILKQMQEMPASYRIQERKFQSPQAIQEPLQDNSGTGQQRKQMGEMQVKNSAKRPADQMLSFLVAKQPRLASHLPKNGYPQAGDDPALRDPLLDDEMRNIK